MIRVRFKRMQRGTLLVEVLVASMVLGTMILATATALGVALDGIQSSRLQSSAGFLLQEEIEPLLTIRDRGWIDDGSWISISRNGTYYVAPSGNSWALVATTSGETVGQFSRNVVISDVYRDGNGQIASSGTIDQSTKMAVATVSWQTFLPHSISATTYITRYKDSLSWIQTTQADFNLGTRIGTAVTNTSGGEVVLGAGGQGNWCEPNLSITALDLPKSSAAKAVTAVEGEAFAGTGQDSSGESLVDINITNTNPPVASIIETFDGYKTNDVFGEPNYAYIATDTNASEVIIIDIASMPFTQVGSFNAEGPEDGESIFVLGNTGYLVQDDRLWNFDLTSKTGARPALDPNGVALAGDGRAVYVVGNYAYVAVEDASPELQIVDVSNPANMVIVGAINLGTGLQGRDVFVNGSGTRAYVVTNASSSLREFYTVDVSNKSNPSVIGSYDTNGMAPNAVEVVPGGRAIIVGSGAEEYQVVNTNNESSPTRCGGLQIDTAVFDSASVLESDNDAFAYIVTGDSNSEFKIIEGGPGGQYAASGTFESSTFNPGYQTAFHRFTATFNKPVGTDIQFQVSGADVGGDGTCATATFTFVGPDGTAGSYFTTTTSPLTATIPLSPGPGYMSSARCFRYRAYLTTSDALQTSTLYDFTVYYSP